MRLPVERHVVEAIRRFFAHPGLGSIAGGLVGPNDPAERCWSGCDFTAMRKSVRVPSVRLLPCLDVFDCAVFLEILQPSLPPRYRPASCGGTGGTNPGCGSFRFPFLRAWPSALPEPTGRSGRAVSPAQTPRRVGVCADELLLSCAQNVDHRRSLKVKRSPSHSRSPSAASCCSRFSAEK